MIFLGTFKAGASVFYAANFHTDQGTIENPSSPEAQLRTPAGVWSDLTAPAIQNAKVGHYGGTIDTTGFAVGQYTVRMQGTVSTAKTTATELSFGIVAYDPSDAVRLGLSAIPNATAGSNGGLPLGDASGDVTVNSGSVDSIWAKAMSELASVPAITGTVLEAISWVFSLARNKRTQTATTETVYKDDGASSLATSTKSDDNTTFTRGKYS